MSSWAVFKDGKQVSKAHPTWAQAETEVHELGYVIQCRYGKTYIDGVSIEPVEGDLTSLDELKAEIAKPREARPAHD